MTRRNYLVAGLCMLVFQIYAQESLTFKEAVQIGLRSNVSLNQQRNQQLNVKAQHTNAVMRMAPTLSATGQAWRTIGNQFIEQEARVINDARTGNVFGTVDANIVLFNGFNRLNSYNQANYQLDAQSYLIKRTQQDVIRDIANQYLQCLLDAELLKIEERNLETQKSSLAQITEQANAGSRAEVDRYTQEAQVKSAEVRVLRARITLRNDLTTLSQTLMLDPKVEISVQEPNWNVNELQFDKYNLDEMYAIAHSNRADFKQRELSKLAAQKGFSASKGATTPSVSAYAGVNSFYSDASIPSFNDQFEENKRTQYGLRINIPILSGWQNQSNIVQSKVTYENAKLDFENTENLVNSDVLRAYRNMNDALLAYDAAVAQYEAASLSFKLEKERYDLGITDLVQYTQANQTFVQAETDLARSRYTLLFQKILIDYAIGTLKEEDIP